MKLHSTIPDELAALDLPALDEVVVMGGGVMELLGLRRADDIDIVVSLRNWQYLRDQLGWKQREKPDFRRFLADKNGRFDVWRWWFNPIAKDRTKLHDLQKMSAQHPSGFYYLKPAAQIMFKQQLGRGKDDADIAALKTLL